MKYTIFNRFLYAWKYLLVCFILCFFGRQKNAYPQHCATDAVFHGNCAADPASCSQTDLIRSAILAVFNEYLINDVLYDQALAEVETRTIPVVVHIIHQCGDEFISDTQCQQAIKSINDDFHGDNFELQTFDFNIPPFINDSLDVGRFAQFQFQLATVDPYGNATTGITRTMDNLTYNGTAGENELKELIQWDPEKYLNIWVVNTTAYQSSAYAQFPSYADTRPDLDGIVTSHRYFGMTGAATPYFHNYRHVLTHEVGHWLGLKHTWGLSPSCDQDDDICSTPNGLGLPAVVYPAPITFTYQLEDGSEVEIYFGPNGIISPFSTSPDQTRGGVLGYYDYLVNFGYAIDNLEIDSLTGRPNTCPMNTDCDSNGALTNLFDNIINMMDYGAEFMFTKDQIKLMVTVLNCPFAGRNKIGKANSWNTTFMNHPQGLETYTDYATITTDSYYFTESDLDNDLLKTDGINLTLSEGNFTGNACISTISPNLSLYGLNYEYDFSPDLKSINVRITGNLANVPETGLDNLSITIDLKETTNTTNQFFKETNNDELTITGFEIHKQSLETKHLYYNNIFDFNTPQPVCVNENDLIDSLVFSCAGVDIGHNLIKHVQACVLADEFSSEALLDAGLYLSTTSPIEMEILVNASTIGEGNIPLLPAGTDIISAYNYYNDPTSPYKYVPLNGIASTINSNQEMYGMARLYSASYTTNLGQEGYVGIRFRMGCENIWLYATIKMSVDMDDGKPTSCFLEGQLQNIPHADNTSGTYIVGETYCTTDPEPTNVYTWMDYIVLNDNLLDEINEQSEGYKDQTDLSIRTNLNYGNNPIIVRLQTESTSFYGPVLAFIDFNKDDAYDYNELVFYQYTNSPTKYYTLNGDVVIPNDVLPGEYNIRIIHSLYKSNNGNSDYYLNPCEPVAYGEVEDYRIAIETPCIESALYDSTASSLPSLVRVENSINVQGQTVGAGENVRLLAGNIIVLDKEFVVEPNTDFYANIESCTTDSSCIWPTEYPWLNGILDLATCCNATEYISVGGYKYILVEDGTNCETVQLYNANGLLYCQNTGNFDCVVAYNLTAINEFCNCQNSN